MAASAPVQIPLDRAPQEMLQYLASYKVVVCAECKYAVQPSAISGHLKDIHRIRHSFRRPFMQYVAKLDLVSPETVLKAEIVEFPVPGLLVRNGLKCSSDNCSHLCASEKRMKTHWYSVHGRPGRPFVDWHPVPLQTFFRGNLHRYFTHSSSDLSTTGHVCHLTQNSAREDGVPEEPHIRGPIPVSISEPLRHTMLDDSDSHLLQHYISSTSLTLAWNLETKVIWQDIVPQLAQQNPFLMHGILACAGLHLAYLYPAQERQYSIAAGIHQDIAMPLFRSVIANVDANNCHATLVFSHLLVIYSWASEKQDSRLLLVEAEGDDLLPPWLYFIRSGCSLLCKVWDCLEGGPIKALVNAWGIPIKAPQSKTELVIHLLSAIPEESSPDAWLAEECKIYHDAAVELGTAFASTPLSTNYTTWDTLRIWPMYTKMEFFELLRTWHPGVLILLAHYYILLKKIEEHWYFEGRAKPLLSTVWRRLEPKWHQYIAWPLQEIGVNPTIP